MVRKLGVWFLSSARETDHVYWRRETKENQSGAENGQSTTSLTIFNIHVLSFPYLFLVFLQEPWHLLALIGGCMIVHKGRRKERTLTASQGDTTARLYQTRFESHGSKVFTIATEISLDARLLDSMYFFLLTSPARKK